MTKTEAISIINQDNDNLELNNKNTHWSNIVPYQNTEGWWINVPFKKFTNNLNFILNNKKEKKIILIQIKANSINNPTHIFRQKKELADIFIPITEDDLYIDNQYGGTNFIFKNYFIHKYHKDIYDSIKLEKSFEYELRKSKKDSIETRQKRLEKANIKPVKIKVLSSQYKRNTDVIVEVLERANGICENCKLPAPFLRKKDNTPYLEVHHKIRLSDNGEDTVNNSIAVCPNCHRALHYG